MSRNVKHKGSVLVFALIVLSFILISAFTVASVTLIERRSANISVNSTTAFQNSDKGMEDFLQQLYKDMNQTDTLDDLADRLNDVYGGGQYICSPGTEDGKVAAYIGNVNTEFIISAYKEGKIVSGNDTRSGWRSVVPITECSEQLANVSRFKVAGNYNSAVRAVFVKLRNSLTRGLLAHWSFEDRAQIARLALDDASRVSYIAQDFSKNDHTLTLCKIAADSADMPITVDLPETDYDLKIDSFAECGNDATTGMDPKKDGAWVGGIVEELGTSGGALGNDDAKEALSFDGIDEYLAMNVDGDCEDDVTNCVDTSLNEDKLQPEDGISISLWVNTDDVSGTIISRYNDSKGYRIYLENGKSCFKLNNNTAVCSSNAINDTNWHHLVGRWQKAKTGGGNAHFYLIVDDQVMESISTVNKISYDDVEKSLVYVGASDETTDFFKGKIDDVRIWDRALTDEEVDRLCLDAQGSTQTFDCLLTK